VIWLRSPGLAKYKAAFRESGVIAFSERTCAAA
jgi:hypothetical protein